jgi:hypothetical protein
LERATPDTLKDCVLGSSCGAFAVEPVKPTVRWFALSLGDRYCIRRLTNAILDLLEQVKPFFAA